MSLNVAPIGVFQQNKNATTPRLNTNNNLYPQTPKVQNDTLELSNKATQIDGLTTKSKVLIGAGVLATLGIATALIAKGKFSQAKDLVKQIEFKPAQTIEEAAAFAKKQLGIKKYELTDLDVANHVNEWLCSTKFNFSGFKIKTLPKDHVGVASMQAQIKTLNINEAKYKHSTSKKTITENIKSLCEEEMILKTEDGRYLLNTLYETPKEFNRLYKMHITAPDKMSFNEKIHFEQLTSEIKQLSQLARQAPTHIRGIARNPEAMAYLNKQNITIEQLEKMEGDELTKVLFDLFDNTNYKVKVCDGGPFRMLNHELGHYLHFKNVGVGKYNKMAVSGDMDLSKRFEGREKAFYDKRDHEIAQDVSFYASYDPGEFVAETYSYLVNGTKYADDIMALYKKYGGPLVA